MFGVESSLLISVPLKLNWFYLIIQINGAFDGWLFLINHWLSCTSKLFYGYSFEKFAFELAELAPHYFLSFLSLLPDIIGCLCNNLFPRTAKSWNSSPALLDTWRKLNARKTFKRRSAGLLNALCTFSLPPVSRGCKVFSFDLSSKLYKIDN